jgi:hypothetical protein
LRRKHQTWRELRQQVERYVRGFPFQYDHATVRLPRDGLAPQPILAVVDGLQCKHCPVEEPFSRSPPPPPFRTRSRKAVKQHRNEAHGKKRVADADLFNRVQLQLWFWEGKERYWVVVKEQSQLPGRASLAGQPSGDGEGPGDSDEEEEGGGGLAEEGEEDNNDDNDDDAVEDQIAWEMQNWCEDVKKRRLQLLKKVPVAELDSWLQFTKWNAVLGKSKHNIVQTYRFLCKPDPDKPALERLLVCWTRIFNRCLNTLADTDNPDVLKWIASPKNEAMSKRPFQLPQNAQTVAKYSGL